MYDECCGLEESVRIHGRGDGDRERRFRGGGEEAPDAEDVVSTEARMQKSLNWWSREIEFDDRAEVGKSSKDVVPVRSEEADVIRLIPYSVGLRVRDGPGSLSTVANEMADIRLKL